MLRRVFIVTVVMGFGILPAFGKTYKNTWPMACGDLWPAVKATLSQADNYAQVQVDDANMKADYQPKHSVHVDVSGVLLQRLNHVTLVGKGSACEMQVVSNYSGWGHDDKADFRKRVEDEVVKAKGAGATPVPVAEAEKPEPTEAAQKPQ
jgi:hypothetical protein